MIVLQVSVSQARSSVVTRVIVRQLDILCKHQAARGANREFLQMVKKHPNHSHQPQKKDGGLSHSRVECNANFSQKDF